MLKMYVRFENWMARDEGATATEYGVLVAFIAILLIVGATVFKDALNAFFGRVATAIGGWAPAG